MKNMISLQTTFQAALDSSRSKPKDIVLLQLWDDLPLWQQKQDIHFIKTGYRPSPESLKDCFKSWFYVHNETVNIWSHIIGAALFVGLAIAVFQTEIPPRYLLATPADIAVCSIYFIGVAICFCLSAIYHTVLHHSHETCTMGLQLDLQGIIILMWSATIPLIYYAFPYDSKLQAIYWSVLSAIALICSIFVFQPRFRNPSFALLRAATFASFALLTMVPVVHSIILYGWHMQNERLSFQWMLVTLVLNATGAMAYVTKFPEKWFEYKFDIFGASHQIFHIMVVFAGITHSVQILLAFDYLHAQEISW